MIVYRDRLLRTCEGTVFIFLPVTRADCHHFRQQHLKPLTPGRKAGTKILRPVSEYYS